MRKNLFIAFEGVDGSGKSTQVKLLANKLKEEGHKVYCTSEPTDRPIGAMIRDIFQHKMEADHRTIAGLFIADRLDHLLNKSTGILKKLDEGYTVIIDRYYFSSYAYQGVHMSLDWVIEANKQSADLIRPDLNIFIDIDPDIAIQRINKGREIIELYETKENLTNVRNKFFEAFEKQKEVEKILITDGNKSPDIIADDIWRNVTELFKQTN